MSRSIFLSFMTIFSTSVSVDAIDYCTPYHANHFLCEAITGFDEECGGNPAVIMTDADKTTIIGVLNEIRSTVAMGKENRGQILPEAANMMQMEWDDELARAAENVAKRCGKNNLHFPLCCRCNIFDRFETNLIQNIFETKSGLQNWKTYLHFFYKQYTSTFKQSEIDSVTSDFLFGDRFILLIRAEVYLVGCSVTRFSRNGNEVHFPVCVFASISGWRGTPVYLRGKPTSKCPAGSAPSKTVGGLCKCSGKCYVTNKMKNIGSSDYDKTTTSVIKTNDKKTTDYCLKNRHHMLCKDLASGSNKECSARSYRTGGSEIYPYGPADKFEKIEYVRALNDFRNNLSVGRKWGDNQQNIPRASNMMELEWDKELEEAAVNLVKSCKIQYFDFCCECHKVDRFDVNLYQIILSKDDKIPGFEPAWSRYVEIVTGKLKSSSRERLNYTKDYFSEDRFYLLARAEISLVGCSASVYKEGTDDIAIHHAVCVFGSLSGWKGTTLFKDGPSCSDCHPEAACSTTYKNLCKCQGSCLTPGGLNSFTWFSEANVPKSVRLPPVINDEDTKTNLLGEDGNLFPFLPNQIIKVADSVKTSPQPEKENSASQGQSSSSDAQTLTSCFSFWVNILLWFIKIKICIELFLK